MTEDLPTVSAILMAGLCDGPVSGAVDRILFLAAFIHCLDLSCAVELPLSDRRVYVDDATLYAESTGDDSKPPANRSWMFQR